MVRLLIKWGAKSFEIDNFDPSTGVKGLKDTLYTLTNVPQDRMKLMCKYWKGLLKDDINLSTCGLIDGTTITLMGDAAKMATTAAATVSIIKGLF